MGFVEAKASPGIPVEHHAWRRFGRHTVEPIPMAKFQCIRCKRFTLQTDPEMVAAIERGEGYGFCGYPGMLETWRATKDGQVIDGQVVSMLPGTWFKIKDRETGREVEFHWGTHDETPPAELIGELQGAT